MYHLQICHSGKKQVMAKVYYSVSVIRLRNYGDPLSIRSSPLGWIRNATQFATQSILYADY